MSPEKTPIADLVKSIRSTYGMTWKDMGSQLGRSEKMLRKLAKGESSGEHYRASLEELQRTGQVQHMTPRRRDSKGKLVPVRSGRSTGAKSRVPEETKGTVVKSPKRVVYGRRTQHMPGGARINTTTMPPSAKAPTRAKAWNDVRQDLVRVTRSQAKADKRVRFTLTMRDSGGRTYMRSIGDKSGFHASDVVSDMKGSGGPEAWFTAQAQAVYTDAGPSTIVGVQATEFSASRSKSERKAQDAAGTRRSRWRR
ncbi:hypothetical protein [Kocuria palustris]|uniref:hypothetical protein n=1 Tax=Kocuria palustris TaxID=71999 RepID=UPI003D71D1BC